MRPQQRKEGVKLPRRQRVGGEAGGGERASCHLLLVGQEGGLHRLADAAVGLAELGDNLGGMGMGMGMGGRGRGRGEEVEGN